MLYCRLISNSIGRETSSRDCGRAGKEKERGAERERECTRTLSGLTKNGFDLAARAFFSAFSCILPGSLVASFEWE